MLGCRSFILCSFTFFLSNTLHSMPIYAIAPKDVTTDGCLSITQSTHTHLSIEGDFSHVKSILIADNKKLRSVTLGDLPKVRTITIHSNKQLYKITFGNMPDLETLDASSNRLVHFSISKAPRLQSLNVSKNKMRELELKNTPILKKLTLMSMAPDDEYTYQKISLPKYLLNRTRLSMPLQNQSPTIIADAIKSFIKKGGIDFKNFILADQEALIEFRKEYAKAWEIFVKEQSYLIQRFMPKNLEDATKQFDTFYDELLDIIEQEAQTEKSIEKFRLNTASLALRGFHLEEAIPTFSETWEDYQKEHIEGMPINLQLLVFLYNLITYQQSHRGFIEARIADFKTIARLSEVLPSARNYSSIGEYLSSFDADKDIKNLIEYAPELSTAKAKIFSKALNKKFSAQKAQAEQNEIKKFTPLIEALFMTMRGHNDRIEDEAEEHFPACSFGSYLNMLRAFFDPSLNISQISAEALGISVVSCF